MCPCFGTGPLYSGHTLDCWDLYLWAGDFDDPRTDVRSQ